MASDSRPLLGELRLISVTDKEQKGRQHKQPASEARYANLGSLTGKVRRGASRKDEEKPPAEFPP